MKLKKALVPALLAGALALTGCATSSPSNTDQDQNSNGPITLRFQSLAFQGPTVKATKDIVAAWNKAHPDVHVKYVQGSWDSVQDQLVTQFQGGTAPDIIHYESAAMTGFAKQGYLADLSPYLSSDVKSSIPQGIWDTVTVDGKVIAAPTLLQSYMVFANTDKLKQAGVTIPSGDTWSWDDFRAAAKATTKNGTYGVGWGLSSPTASMLSLGMNFGAQYFTGTGDNAQISVGANELALPELVHQMAYQDKSLDPSSLTQSGSDVMPGFLKGKYAMTVQGSYVAQTLSQSAPDGFHWAVLPPLQAEDATQAADPQTLSVSAQSPHVKQAAEFINFYMQAKNLAAEAEGDWLIPASNTAVAQVRKDTGEKNGWGRILDSGQYLTKAPFQSVTDYPQWKDQIATPAFQQYLGNSISSDELKAKLSDGWSQVSGR
jgi:ABC-type glycerol-3-phosphate transport system substrate-binding protein